MRNLYHSLTICLLLARPAAGRAQSVLPHAGAAPQQPVLRLTLSEAIAVALRRSPLIQGSAADARAAAGELASARSKRLPWLSTSLFASDGDEPSIAAGPPAAMPQMIMGLPRGAFLDGNLTLMAPLDVSGRLGAQVRRALAMRDAAGEDLDTVRLDVTLAVRRSYRLVLARQALVDVASAGLQADQEHLRVDTSRYQQGAVPLVTVDRDRAEAAAGQQQVTNARRDVDLAQSALKTSLGLPQAQQVELSGDDAFYPSGPRIASLLGAASGSELAGAALDRALLELARRRRPELVAARERVRAAAAERAAVRGEFLPQANLFAMGDAMGMEGARGRAAAAYGIAASLPLYNGGDRRARSSSAEADLQHARADVTQEDLQVQQDVEQALVTMRAAEQNMATAQSAVTAADEGYRVALQRYEAGRSVNVELLDALATRTQAAANEVQALYDYNVAWDELRRAVGE